jgi:hypothetical protein
MSLPCCKPHNVFTIDQVIARSIAMHPTLFADAIAKVADAHLGFVMVTHDREASRIAEGMASKLAGFTDGWPVWPACPRILVCASCCWISREAAVPAHARGRTGEIGKMTTQTDSEPILFGYAYAYPISRWPAICSAAFSSTRLGLTISAGSICCLW